MNADAAVGAGVAMTLDRADATGPAIAAAVARLLEERRFRAAAATVRDEIAAMPAADSVVTALTRGLGLQQHQAESSSTGG